MKLTLYHSLICPRCARARKHLASLLGDTYSDLVDEVEIVSQPLKTWRAGVRLIPALRYGDSQLSGVVLSFEQIERFLITHGILNADTDNT